MRTVPVGCHLPDFVEAESNPGRIRTDVVATGQAVANQEKRNAALLSDFGSL